MGLLDLDGGSHIEKHVGIVNGLVGVVVLNFHLEGTRSAHLQIGIQHTKGKGPSGALLNRASVTAFRKKLEEAEAMFEEADEVIKERERQERELTSEIDRITEPKKEG